MNGFQYFNEGIQGYQAGEIAAKMSNEPGWHTKREGIWHIAYHEAGHTIFNWLHGKRPYSVEAHDGNGRVCYGAPTKPLGLGPSDSEKIGEYASVLAACNRPADLGQLEKKGEALLRAHWTHVRRLAFALVEKEILYLEDLEKLLTDLPVLESKEVAVCGGN